MILKLISVQSAVHVGQLTVDQLAIDQFAISKFGLGPVGHILDSFGMNVV